MVGEPARHFAPLSVHVAPKPQATGWMQQRWVKGMAMLVGAIACSGLGYLVFKATGASSDEPVRTERAASRTHAIYEAEPTYRRPPRVTVSSGGQAIPEHPAQTERATLTDSSFLATSYVRKKVSLPNISGNCVVKGNGALDVGECLRRQQE